MEFENRVFYVPNTQCEITIKGHILCIYIGDDSKFVIANGLKCWQFLSYNAQDDTIQTYFEAATIDGKPTNEWLLWRFPFDAKEIPRSEQNPMIVVPKRDYTELINLFLAEKPTLDDFLKQFLLEHPDFFNAYWPKEKRDMQKRDWERIDADLKLAREDPEHKSLLLQILHDNERIPEEYREFPLWLHDFYVKVLGEE